MEGNVRRFCRMCGKQIPPDSAFCAYCGTAVNVPQPTAAAEQGEKWRDSVQPKPENPSDRIRLFQKKECAPDVQKELPASDSGKKGEVFRRINNIFPVMLLFVMIMALVAFFIPFYSIDPFFSSGEKLSALQLMLGKSDYIEGSYPGAFILAIPPIAAFFLSYLKKKQFTCWICFVLGILQIVLVSALKSILSDKLRWGGFETGIGYVLFLIAGIALISLGILGAVIFAVGSEDASAALKKLFAAFGIVVGIGAAAILLFTLIPLLGVLACSRF